MAKSGGSESEYVTNRMLSLELAGRRRRGRPHRRVMGIAKEDLKLW